MHLTRFPDPESCSMGLSQASQEESPAKLRESDLRTLVYKRTHVNDPDGRGIWGNCDCMGSVRGFSYEAVIAIGGVGEEAKSHDIHGKINWIGIGPKRHKYRPRRWRGPLVTFDRFVLFNEDGPTLASIAPLLLGKFGRRIGSRRRVRFTTSEQAQIEKILALADNAEPSTGDPRKVVASRCPPKKKCPPRPRRRKC